MNEPLSSAQHDLIERVAWSLVWLSILTTGVDLWGEWSLWPGVALISPLLVLTGIVGGAVLWTMEDPISRAMQRAGFSAAVVTVVLSQGLGIAARHFYTTDSTAFNQVATQLVLQGHNPYTSSMAGASRLLQTASNYWTYTLSGGHVTHVSYPAGSFLLQAPLMALGVHHLPTDWLDLTAWLVTSVLLFRILPPTIRWLAPLLMLTDAFLGSFANGGTDALFIPFLVLALWQWDRFVTDTRPGLVRWLGPVSLGVACSIKQSPWFLVPFLLVAIALEARAAQTNAVRTTARYAGITAGVFLLINLPFIVWNPSAWLHGSLLPLINPLVPDGQGLVTLALHGLTGGVELHLLWLSGVLVLLAGLAALLFWYPALKRSWLFLLPLVLFVPGRSLTNYLLDLFPIALVAAVSVRPAPRGSGLATAAWVRRVLVATPLTGAVLFAVVAFQSAPLTLAVDNVTTAHAQQIFASITVTVHNNSAQSVTPNFMISIGGGHPTGFWRQSLERGALPLRPGASATITIRPTTWIWAPHRADYWLVDAYTSSPAAVSTSPLRRWPLGSL